MAKQSHTLVTIPQTHVRHIASASVGQDYQLSVALPDDFGVDDQLYPVLYVLDDYWCFPLFTQVVRLMHIFKELPQMVIVGIGYPTTDLGDLFALRMRDYTPTANAAFVKSFPENMGLPLTRLPRSSGGANQFLSFLRTELFPFIDANYQGDPKRRILSGLSFGGLFGLYALFRHPESFSDYLILSPSIWWDEKAILQDEVALFEQHKSLPIKLFLSVGEAEGEGTVLNVEELAALLHSRKYSGLLMNKEILPQETHLSVVAGAFSKGIRAIFAD